MTSGPVTVAFGAPTALAAKVTALVPMLMARPLPAGSLLDLRCRTGRSSPCEPAGVGVKSHLRAA